MEIIDMYSDRELLDDIRSGRSLDKAVRHIYRHHAESLARFVTQNQGSAQDGEDMLQETIVQFIDVIRRDKFRGESSIKTFLFALNRNLWLNELKRRSRAGKREMKFEHMKAKEETGIPDALADRETRNELVRMMEQMGEACRKILLLFYYENRSMKEILAETDYENEQVVRNKKYKCLKQLENMIRENPAIEKNLKSLLHG